MFTAEQRERVCERVLELARADGRITGGALTGSTAVGMDRWSDVDVAFGFADGVEAKDVLDEWTEGFDREFGVVHHWDLGRGAILYRVFLLRDALELDVGLWPASEFGARGPTFRLVFGESSEQPPAREPPINDLVGLGWHHSLHARAAIDRGHPWKAEFYVGALKDHALALACIRLGEPFEYAGGIDRLPRELTDPYEETIVRSLEPSELSRALSVASRLFLGEVRHVDAELADGLRPLLPD